MIAESKGSRELNKFFGLIGIIALAFWITMALFDQSGSSTAAKMKEAAFRMNQALQVVKQCRLAAGVNIEPEFDLNQTGLIGLETSPLTTTLGNLEAKRTTLNPDFAGLMVYLLVRAGLKQGEVVAIGASSSFPGLIIATLTAVEALKAEPALIVSLGSSEWGANIPEFNWLDIENCLTKTGLVKSRSLAVSLGGDEDRGSNLPPEFRDSLIFRINQSGLRLIEEKQLEDDVRHRINVYKDFAGPKKIRVFVNIGGSWANLGTSSSVLKLNPGLVKRISLPTKSERGVIQEMSAEGVKVIHLLNIKRLAEDYKLPWDPKPLPEPGKTAIYKETGSPNIYGKVISVVYLIVLIVLVLRVRSCRYVHSKKTLDRGAISGFFR